MILEIVSANGNFRLIENIESVSVLDKDKDEVATKLLRHTNDKGVTKSFNLSEGDIGKIDGIEKFQFLDGIVKFTELK